MDKHYAVVHIKLQPLRLWYQWLCKELKEFALREVQRHVDTPRYM